jgi:hypothetical protein
VFVPTRGRVFIQRSAIGGRSGGLSSLNVALLRDIYITWRDLPLQILVLLIHTPGFHRSDSSIPFQFHSLFELSYSFP